MIDSHVAAVAQQRPVNKPYACVASCGRPVSVTSTDK